MASISKTTKDGIPYFISLEEALEICNQNPIKSQIEILGLDKIHGRILAKDLVSKVDDPAFDNSSMDGFAVRVEDTHEPPQTLQICGVVQAAADSGSVVVKPGQAARIMTGAPIPEGANSVLMIEKCEVHDNKVILLEESKPHFIRKKGENLKKGEIALKRGLVCVPPPH